MNEPRVVESVTNECQSLGRAHESSSARAEQLIACLEGEIAKRDETIARLEPQLNRAIQANYDMREELAACRVAVENCEVFRAELAALKAQEPVAVIHEQHGFGWYKGKKPATGTKLYADKAPEAKAQGVVMPERWNVPRPMWKDARQPYGNPLNHADIEAAEKFNLALDEVARLNAAPVQQVSVPDERAAFEREDRYIVIKRSDMDRIPNQKVVNSFLGALGELSAHSVRIPQRKFLVIESDWPEYDPAWKLIQDRVQGRPILDAAPAAPAAHRAKGGAKC